MPASQLGPHEALIWTMVLASAADQNMSDAEMRTIGEMVEFLPVFDGYDFDALATDAGHCADLLQDDNGLDKVMKAIKHALPKKLRETAYALAVDVVASDDEASQEELRLLEMLRHALEVERLAAAAIERGARARHMRL